MRVRVCDDVDTIADDWVAAIKESVSEDYDVARLQDAKDEVSSLLLRKFAVENGSNPVERETEFDSVDILIVDYDLLHLDKSSGSRTTGEGVARLARAFSRCGTIVVMNQFKRPQFDLGMRGNLDSFADTNVDATLIGCPALWQQLEPAANQFDPTTWTPLPDLLAAARNLSEKFSAEGMDAAIMPLLGLETVALADISDTAFAFLSLKAETADELEALTVSELLNRSLDENAVKALSADAPEILFNFAAFRIVKWMDRAVLRPMDVLIDAPHLIDRLPFLIDREKVDFENPLEWARAAALPTDKLRWDILEKYHNKLASDVLSRPIFDWYRIAHDDQIDELQDSYLDEQSVRFYLAEDTSRFVEKDKLTRYRAEFHNFGDRRAIERLGDVTYGPLRRVHFG